MSPWLLEISQHIIISYQECLGKINHSRSLGVSDTTAIPLSEAGKRICLVLHFKVGSQSCSAVRDQPGWLTVTELSPCVSHFLQCVVLHLAVYLFSSHWFDMMHSERQNTWWCILKLNQNLAALFQFRHLGRILRCMGSFNFLFSLFQITFSAFLTHKPGNKSVCASFLVGIIQRLIC